MVKALVFDLDGTLLNTIYDISDSVNLALDKYHLPPNSVEDYISYVGNGMKALIERSIHQKVSNEDFNAIMQLYDETYNANNCHKTIPFPHVLETLKKLKAQGYLLAVISNKPDYASKKMIDYYFKGLFTYVSGAKPSLKAKPDPMALTLFAQTFNLAKDEIIYIGDSRVDATFSEAFGVKYFLMEYGYENKELLHSFKPVAFLKDFQEILDYFKD